jgi:iron complex transport system substrate-binding protein
MKNARENMKTLIGFFQGFLSASWKRPRWDMRVSLLAIVSTVSVVSHAEISVTDYLGRTVTLEKPAQRIIALAPHIVENLYSAGAGERLVGAVDHCDYPLHAKKIPRVGAISAYSLEAIVALKPDLVVMWNSGLGSKNLPKFIELGLTVYASDPKSLEDIPRSIRDYGVLTGQQAVANKSAEEFTERLQGLREKYRDQTKLSVLYQVWNQPLQTLNDDHIISDLIRLCGGTNAFGDAPTIAPKISVESVIARNPDVIIASGMGEEKPEWLDDWKKYTGLTAVKNGNLFFVPPDIIQRHTVRMLQGVEQVCEALEEARATDALNRRQ